MLKNFLEGCALAKEMPKRVILQTGGKACSRNGCRYGVNYFADDLGSIMAFIRDPIRCQHKRMIRESNWDQISITGMFFILLSCLFRASYLSLFIQVMVRVQCRLSISILGRGRAFSSLPTRPLYSIPASNIESSFLIIAA